MSYTLTFTALHQYNASKSGITIPIELSAGGQIVKLEAKLDTGASYCTFQRKYGEMLGLDIESGLLKSMSFADGRSFDTFGHEVSLSAIGFQLDVVVYFAADQNFRRNILGRYGWIQQLRLGIIDYDGKLYISTYDE